MYILFFYLTDDDSLDGDDDNSKRRRLVEKRIIIINVLQQTASFLLQKCPEQKLSYVYLFFGKFTMRCNAVRRVTCTCGAEAASGEVRDFMKNWRQRHIIFYIYRHSSSRHV